MRDAVILSDLHPGSANCQARSVADFLGQIAEGILATDRLILNGDVFDSIDFCRLHVSHWKVLSLLHALSEQIEIVWLAGNHGGSAEVVSHLLGVQVEDEYILPTGDERLLVLHGHVFDAFIETHPWLTWLADRANRLLQWLDRSHRLARLAKRGSKTFLRCTRKIAAGAVERARQRACSMVACGHTHIAEAATDQPIAYFNSGCWTEQPCNHLTVNDGKIYLHTFIRETAWTDSVLRPMPSAAS